MARSERDVFPSPTARPSRRSALGLIAGGAALPLLAGCGGRETRVGLDVSGVLPDLELTMTRASDGARVTERDYRGQVVALFLGFTFCPDVCPMTLANLSEVARRLGPGAEGLSILFVTVDPGRDTLDILRRYAGAFHPRADALRGTENQIAMLARRYRVTYEVEPDGPDGRYTVTHGPSVYVFDASGEARLMLPRFETGDADIEGAVAELSRLLPARAA